jgi:hypothetical protein
VWLAIDKIASGPVEGAHGSELDGRVHRPCSGPPRPRRVRLRFFAGWLGGAGDQS